MVQPRVKRLGGKPTLTKTPALFPMSRGTLDSDLASWSFSFLIYKRSYNATLTGLVGRLNGTTHVRCLAGKQQVCPRS